MSPALVLAIIIVYFSLLIAVAWYTSRGATTETFFTANKSAPWYLVAFGMIGTSLSGVTFISVPGAVGKQAFSYFQMVLGYLPGYAFIALVLMPLYYKLNLVSIYTYLEERFGFWSYKTGSFFFLLSRSIGSAFRLYLTALVLQLGIFDPWGIPFELNVLLTILLIWIYTFKGGIKTIIFTDTLQTFFLVSALVISVFLIANELHLGIPALIQTIQESPYSQVFFWEWNDEKNFFKQFLAGTFIAITMTGMDQDLMQKNLTCKNLQEAQKNMFSFCVVLVVVNLLFLTLGALLYTYAHRMGIAMPAKTDNLYPMLALNHLGLPVAIFFLLGITASSYASADSALASLTTAFCIDFLKFKHRTNEAEKARLKLWTHIGFSVLLYFIILIFRWINDDAVINAVFRVAGYTYGPLLGLFTFGLFTAARVRDWAVPFVCVTSPIICYLLNAHSEAWFNGFKFGFELLVVNGAITFVGLWLFSYSGKKSNNA
ncbi:MAG: sodium:solute symporter [Cytophagales bacterium]|nr:sodium:solute symporter [Bernardetiaceae bacterium]MDW8203568.1 sodium:solute symporter [Cytophagales bacterium]